MPVTVVNMIPNFAERRHQPRQRTKRLGQSGQPAPDRGVGVYAGPCQPPGNAPIFVSTDGGTTWALNVVLPGGNTTGDTSLRFATTSNVLYAGILRTDTDLQMNILRSGELHGSRRA